MKLIVLGRLCALALLSCALPLLARADCMQVPSSSSLELHVRCSNGAEFKVVEKSPQEEAAAKIRLVGPFETAEFSAVYVGEGQVVKLTGVRPATNRRATDRPAIALYAFRTHDQLTWVSVASSGVGSSLWSEVLHNLNGSLEIERIPGAFELPVPKNYQLVERRIEVPTPDDLYRRLGF